MKFCVFLDDDGHFQLTSLVEREKTLKILKGLSMGDYFYNTAITVPPYKRCNTQEWEKFLQHFEQRGIFEIVKL